jgi:hypothetical protein
VVNRSFAVTTLALTAMPGRATPSEHTRAPETRLTHGRGGCGIPSSYPVRLEGTESLVSLRYPNGRIHETALTRARELRVGDQFELHGRQWRAVDSKQKRGRATKPRPRILCVLATLPVQP